MSNPKDDAEKECIVCGDKVEHENCNICDSCAVDFDKDDEEFMDDFPPFDDDEYLDEYGRNE